VLTQNEKVWTPSYVPKLVDRFFGTRK